MKILVIGAGASVEEAKRLNVPQEYWPPLINNFAEKMWNSKLNQFYVYWICDFLKSEGYDAGNDPMQKFIDLKNQGIKNINVERLLEYCSINQDNVPFFNGPLPRNFINGFFVASQENNKITVNQNPFPNYWFNLLYHGIVNPLISLLSQAFYINGKGWKPLAATRLICKKLTAGDLIINLNYDTLFEIGAKQCGYEISYIPMKRNMSSLLIAKPHGSLNFYIRKNNTQDFSMQYTEPENIASLSDGEDFNNFYKGIIPPRYNKQYQQHPIANRICSEIKKYAPDELIFWGVGMTDSDTDLLKIYKFLSKFAQRIDFINPEENIVNQAKNLLKLKPNCCFYFENLEQWIS